MSAAPSPLRLVSAALVTAVVLLLLGLLARAPLAGSYEDEAVLRLTWRLRGEEVVECRRPTEAELADLPVHMRNPDACVGEIPPFDLTVAVDGEPRVERTVRPSGARGDRPLYVYEELWLPPGTHRVRVAFRGRDGASAAALHLDTTVELEPGQALLVTRSATGDLEVRRPEA